MNVRKAGLETSVNFNAQLTVEIRFVQNLMVLVPVQKDGMEKTAIIHVLRTVIPALITPLVMYAQKDIMVDIAKVLVRLIVQNVIEVAKNVLDAIQVYLVTNVHVTWTNVRNVNHCRIVSNVKILVGIRK